MQYPFLPSPYATHFLCSLLIFLSMQLHTVRGPLDLLMFGITFFIWKPIFILKIKRMSSNWHANEVDKLKNMNDIRKIGWIWPFDGWKIGKKDEKLCEKIFRILSPERKGDHIWNLGYKVSNALSSDMRVSVICQKCRYAKISQLLEVRQFCRYVGETQIKRQNNLLSLPPTN